MEIKTLAEEMQKILEDKKALDIEVIAVGEKTILADYFIIASGTSTTHIKSLSEELEFQIKSKYGIFPGHVEGASTSRWILMDYKDIVVHIFHPQERTEYNLEKLWHMKKTDLTLETSEEQMD